MQSISPSSPPPKRNTWQFLAFNALVLPLVPLLAAYTLWRRYGQGRSAASLHGQWGRVPVEVGQALQGGAPRVWLHAVSVGETIAARPVARALKQELPGCRIALSVTTDTGFETAQGALKAREVDAVFYFPLDLPWTVRRSLRAVAPDALLMMETELWPNILHLARRRGARTILVNGRVSDNLLRRAPRLGWIWRWMMHNLDAVLMRSAFDAGRMEQLKAPSTRLVVTGDVKLDNASPDVAGQRTRWRETLSVEDAALFWVAGSHPGEEDMVLDAFATLRADFPALRLLIAPRHIERAGEVEAMIRARGLPIARRTQVSASTDVPILLLDTVGELAGIYAAADVAFVGGSLIERGGHNVLEPVLSGVPVVFGPYVANFREAAALVQSAGIGQMVPDAAGLEPAIRHWLADDAARGAVAGHAAEALAEHRGAAGRVARLVAEILSN